MTKPARRTIVAHGRLAMRALRLDAARNRDHGLQLMTFEMLAVRLAGGFSAPIDDETLRDTIQAVLPATRLGELERIKLLPGMVNAAADSLRKAWRAGIDLPARADGHPRLADIATLEAAVLAQLPSCMMRPVDLVDAALRRLGHAEAILGSVEIVGITELSPCWRPLLQALGAQVTVTWSAGPRPAPDWLGDSMAAIARTPAETPAVQASSAATAYHEAIEALRWARQLLASGEASPGEIAIAAASTAEYDDHFLALRGEASLNLHFVHGMKVTATRDGQAAAALADIMIRGLSQTRMRRLASLCGSGSGPFSALPDGWTRVLPADAPLASPLAWTRLIDRLAAADWSDTRDHAAALADIVAWLGGGPANAAGIGDSFLTGSALAIWNKALQGGPASALDRTLETLKQDDGLEPCVSVAWMPASALAASPRRFARLIGLNSSRWPRGIAEDRLIPDHIIPIAELDPLPVAAADRRDFGTILVTTERQVVLSHARRDSEGRLLGRSPLLDGGIVETYLPRNAAPRHAFSEVDRLMARPKEFSADPQAMAAATCWHNWHRNRITAHDGQVRANHPLLLAILDRPQSASSLRRLLRNPLGFVWQYGLRLRAPEGGADPLVLDPLGMGELVHATLDLALQKLEAAGGLANAGEARVAKAVQQALVEVAGSWEGERALPPALIWQRSLQEAAQLAVKALGFRDEQLAEATAYSEIAFGGATPRSEADSPWDPRSIVEIPRTGIKIAGYIDRLDLSRDGKSALVRDYKTGRAPRDPFDLDGGRELQRCLYAFAVKALLGPGVSIRASLLYLREGIDLQLADPEATLTDLGGFLRAARANLAMGNALIGPDTGNGHDDLAFALPANAGATYCRRKQTAAAEILGDSAAVWEAQ